MKRIAMLVPLALIVAGCGSSSSSAPDGASGSETAVSSTSPAELTLSESEFKITPINPTLAHAGPVTITVRNAGAVTHALTVQTPSGPLSSASIAPGASATLRVNLAKSGTYTFFCPIPGHEQAGMKGTLVVSSGSGAASDARSSSSGGGAPSRSSGY